MYCRQNGNGTPRLFLMQAHVDLSCAKRKTFRRIGISDGARKSARRQDFIASNGNLLT